MVGELDDSSPLVFVAWSWTDTGSFALERGLTGCPEVAVKLLDPGTFGNEDEGWAGQGRSASSLELTLFPNCLTLWRNGIVRGVGARTGRGDRPY